MNFKLVRLFAVLVFASVGIVGVAHAQDDETVKANIPFDFYAGKQKMPAGYYRIGIDLRTEMISVTDKIGKHKLFFIQFGHVLLLRISHSWVLGERVTGLGRTACNRVQGNTRLDRGRKPDDLRAEASGSAEHWRSEVDYSLIYRDCEVVMNGQAN